MLTLVAGLAGGAVHALSGPDHLAAVAPLSLGNRWHGLRTGLEWGVGHGVGVLVLGAIAMFARDALHLERISGGSEALVGFLLVGLGIWACVRARRLAAEPEAWERGHRHRSAATLGLGALHGSAGASHFVAIVAAAGLGTLHAATYLGAYVLGAAAAMALVGASAGELSARGGLRYLPWLLGFSGLVSAGVGLAWIATSFAVPLGSA